MTTTPSLAFARQATAGNVINLDALLAWDPACPVLLPLGPITIAPIISASAGVFVPFFVFLCAFFYYMYGVWYSNASPSAHTPYRAGRAPFYTQMFKRGRKSVNRNNMASTEDAQFMQQPDVLRANVTPFSSFQRFGRAQASGFFNRSPHLSNAGNAARPSFF
jgi:hypothetical protein